MLKYLAARGWVGFNANYRLSPGATFPDHLVDVKAALAWVRGHADEYGIDPDFVCVTGGSAGGHLTALMALTANDPEYQPGFEEADTTLQAAVPFYGVYDFANRNQTMGPEFLRWIAQPLVIKAFIDEEPERFAAASRRSTRSGPTPRPSWSCTATRTRWRPVEDARAFARAQAVGDVSRVARSSTCELHGAQHAFDVFGSPRTRRMVRATEAASCSPSTSTTATGASRQAVSARAADPAVTPDGSARPAPESGPSPVPRRRRPGSTAS